MLNLKQARGAGRPDADFASLDSGPFDALTVAEQLRSAREQSGLSLDEVAAYLKIRRVYLDAIEEGRDSDLPGHTYAVGFVRAYADYLKLDADSIVSRFKGETAESDDKTKLVFPSPMPEGRTPGGALILIAIVCAALVYGAWIYMSSQDRSLAEIVPALPESLERLISTDPVEATPASIDSTLDKEPVASEKTPDEALPKQNAATSNSDQPASVEKTEVSSVPDKTTEDSATPPQATPPQATPPQAEAVQEAPVSPVVSIVETPAIIETPVIAKPSTDEAAVAAGAQVPTDVAADAAKEKKEPAVRPVEENTTVAPEANVPEKVARILDTIEIPAPNNPEISTGGTSEDTTGDTAAVSVAVMPPTPPKDDATGPRRFGDENVTSRITILAEIDSWVEVRDADGSLLLTRLLKTGDSYKVPDRTGLKMHTGNAGGLRIEVDGISAPGIGPVGAVRRDVALDADALKKGDANR
jgi:cytoskeleton protein RodZ